MLLLLLISGTLGFNLNIYHTNDIHARYDQRGATEGGKCSDEDKTTNNCYGGMARHATFFKDHVDETANNLILSAGDWFTGTTYFIVYEGELTAKYLNQFNYDAWSLGNHEFDKGEDVIARTIDQLNGTKTLVANMAVTSASTLHGKIEKSMVKEFADGTKVGLIGYLTPETSFLSRPGDDVSFSDVIEAVKEEVEVLQQQGVDIIVAVGHAGIDTDKRICEEVSGVDVVVGGHTNTFLWNGDFPEGAKIKEEVAGPYPLPYNSGSCLVVQAYAYGKYMGNLSVSFNEEGEVVQYEGQPVLLWNNTLEDSETLGDLASYNEQVKAYASEVVGFTNEPIDGTRTSCRSGECELGNIVADAFLDSYRANDNEVTCCFINGGSIRAGLDGGNITFEDVLTVMPYGNTVDRTSMNGSILIEVFEHSVSTFEADVNIGDQGRYLQVSGFKVTYNTHNNVTSKVAKLQVMDSNGVYGDVEADKIYHCAVPNYLAAGGDGYAMLKSQTAVSGDTDVAAFNTFLQQHSPLNQYSGIQDLPSRSFFSNSASTSSLFLVWGIVKLWALL